MPVAGSGTVIVVVVARVPASLTTLRVWTVPDAGVTVKV